jgi:hypothetical protein
MAGCVDVVRMCGQREERPPVGEERRCTLLRFFFRCSSSSFLDTARRVHRACLHKNFPRIVVSSSPLLCGRDAVPVSSSLLPLLIVVPTFPHPRYQHLFRFRQTSPALRLPTKYTRLGYCTIFSRPLVVHAAIALHFGVS